MDKSPKKSAMQASARFRINRRDIAYEVIAGEAVLINFDTGTYYRSQGTGAYIYGQLAAGASLGSVVDELASGCADAPGDVAELITPFVQLLIQQQLLVDANGSAPAEQSAAPCPPGLAWTQPLLEVHRDMQELLLVDPIHDVDDSGWPATK